jgi:uncharacterized protein
VLDARLRNSCKVNAMTDAWKTTIVPDTFDNDILPFWEGLKEHKFLLHRCRRCGAHYWPMTLCPKHDDNVFDEMEWAPTSGKGRVFSWEVVHRIRNPAFAAEVPYALVLVELDEGPIFPTRLAGPRPADLRIGMKVEVVFEDIPETGLTLPLFKLST